MSSRGRRTRAAVAFAAAALLGVGMTTSAMAAAGGSHPEGSPGKSSSDITGSFSSDCTDFSSTSSKDFSHIDFVFADGSTETVSQFSDTHNYTRTGDKVISSATVKAGTTSNTYNCTPTQAKPACSNGSDDDGDGKIDSADPGCTDANDNDETDPAPKPACSDGKDNDGDGKIDSADPGCTDANDNDETDAAPKPACSDGTDNDGDGKIDSADPGCTDANDNDETDPVPPNQCEHNGLTGLLTGTDDPTLAKALYDGGLKAIPILVDPHGEGPISTPVGDALAPVDEATGLPVGLEARCAISLADGNGVPAPPAP